MKYELTRAKLEEMVLCIVQLHLDEDEAMEYALSVCGEFSSEEAEEADFVWPDSKERIDIIGTNGNTAEHYAIVHKAGVYEA